MPGAIYSTPFAASPNIWLTIAWPMVAGACLTLGLIERHIGLTQPPHAARLPFALSAFTVAGISGLELALSRADCLADWWPSVRGPDSIPRATA